MKKAITWVQGLRPWRVYKAYSVAGGNLLAAGMSFEALFAVFAAVWVGFSLFGVYLSSHDSLRQAVIDFINLQIPGLISSGGPIDPTVLSSTTSFGWTGGQAIFIVLYTAINWLNYTRIAIRATFSLAPSTVNYVLLKLYDLVIAVSYGLLVIVSAAATVVVTKLATTLLPAFGLKDAGQPMETLVQVLSLIIIVLFDMVLIGGMIRILSGVPIPWRNVFTGAILGALAIGVLKTVGALLLTHTSNNPLLASFAVFIGLLIYFNIASRIFLLTASWIAVDMKDKGIEAIDLGWIVPRRHSKQS